MNIINNILVKISGYVWGPITILLLVGTGLFLSIKTRFIQFRKLPLSVKLLFSKEHSGDGDITPFQALMTSLASTIGTGNIAGVSSAIVLGGPGAIFWMWVSAAFGGASKYGEALLAIKYRITNEDGEKSGGPMFYIEKGMKEKFGRNFKWLGFTFAFFGFLASFGIGNMIQANSVASAINESFGISSWITGIILSILVGAVIIGGIKNIGRITDKIVPAMAIGYVLGSLIILTININLVPNAFAMIFKNAFSGKAVGGGVLGTVIRFGVARGVFSNEAGLGSAAIAHAASTNDKPVIQGLIGSLGSVIDTLIICTMTALVILVSPLITIGNDGMMLIEENMRGAALTTFAFDTSLPILGGYIVSLGLVFFAFSTILGWFYYGSKCLEYIAGIKSVKYYKFIWVILCFAGAMFPIKVVWNISDIFNGLMAIPNLIALISLSPIIVKLTIDFEKKITHNNDKKIKTKTA
ncbi:sodium:alanine symporter family protein [Clostridium sp. D2Q-14]|uniref:alanine/glycine:cation symporter family protein n=1 Tax=Anaeromonas gelatinilytica TaxID=2683194 RepID=UPI00193C4B0F|nr:sodium:alanine symporter family protein [Anaeromonas gelatinilytica]MBS4534911.1 sodium:alanine symporter family protein [Anaeromonas gelatinilytica]